MIVGMKKITVISVAEDAADTVAYLQALGALHLVRTRTVDANEGGQSQTVRERLARLNRVIQFLGDVRDVREPEKSAPKDEMPVQEALARAETLDQKLDELAQVDEERQKLVRVIDEFAPFGDFDPAVIQRLEQHGVYVQLYRCHPDALAELPDDVVIEIIEKTSTAALLVTVSDAPGVLPLNRLTLPETSLAALRERKTILDECHATALSEVQADRDLLAALISARVALTDELVLRETQEGLERRGQLVWLEGYCPEPRLEQVHKAAATAGWGIVERDPEPGEMVPTLIRNPRWLKPVEVVFDFIDTFPGYHEKDVGAAFYVFLTLFYAILIGDAGYGMLFLGGLVLARGVLKVRIPPLVARLFVVFNLAAVVWGVLTANYFGITLPADHFLARIALIDGSDINRMMVICFSIGLVHLTLAHLWALISVINSLKAIAELGWLMTVWAAYFLAMYVIAGVEFPPFMAYVGGLGVLLALVFSGSLLSVAGLFQFPFAVINCFSDIASYLRLFAVAAAALALAQVFNGMAGNLISNGGVVGILGGLLILLLGHSLNLVLGLLSVLVHGLRLNLLEFSGHVGLEWAGFKYRPFRMNRFSDDQLQ